MIDPVTLNLWQGRIGFVLIAAILIFAALLPLGGAAGGLPWPDILLCVIFAWMMRRPDFLPLLLLTAVAVLADILLMRPIGLWAALTILASEIIRARGVLMRELSFLMEWAVVGAIMLAMLLVNRFFFALTLLPQPSFAAAVLQWLLTVLAYPAVVLVAGFALGLRKPSLGETNDFGRRI